VLNDFNHYVTLRLLESQIRDQHILQKLNDLMKDLALFAHDEVFENINDKVSNVYSHNWLLMDFWILSVKFFNDGNEFLGEEQLVV